MADRIRLVVLFGGRSAEHEVSCTTAVNVLQALDPARYDVVPVGVTHEGRWVLAEEAAKVLAAAGPAALPPALAAEGPAVEPLATVGKDTPSQTVVLPLLHGPFGEDGTVQGLLELADVPYVGSGVLGSAAAMDKKTAKRLAAEAGIPQATWIVARDRADSGRSGAPAVARDLAGRVEAELGWPVFVKPSNLGSSVGVTKAQDARELHDALRLAFAYDEWALVEEAIAGREIECGVLGDPAEASLPGEVRPSREFYDYEDKYVLDGADLLVPAPLSDHETAAVRRLALAAFAAVEAEAMARVDFFYEEAGRGFLLNEVNTIPGFTPISMYPKMWEASGVPYAELIDRLVQLALDRHARRSHRIGRRRQLEP
ncbi:MAG: D-alanine--D-alanine ligase [Acidimicrobiia bacterium]|nr:D-alanine--D-alanine ligase [Acidimicrobiia bacterium]